MQNLTIAEGTDAAVTVRDCRGDFQWAQVGATRPPVPPRAIFIHHTASAGQPQTRRTQLDAMRLVATSAPYGLPYNFVVFAYPHTSIYYLNDVDHAWPHTYRWNDATAIALWGDWSISEPPTTAVARMARLIRALWSMWGHDIRVKTHRDVFPTICPGDFLQREFGSSQWQQLDFSRPEGGYVWPGCPYLTPEAATVEEVTR
jgi:N-acetylmuramoyl-L-alanine amidase-like protein